MLILRPVTSGTVKAIGFDSGNLFVLFSTDKLYCYSGVPRSVHDAFMAAPSKGSFVSSTLRGTYPATVSALAYRVASLASFALLLPGRSYGF